MFQTYPDYRLQGTPTPYPAPMYPFAQPNPYVLHDPRVSFGMPIASQNQGFPLNVPQSFPQNYPWIGANPWTQTHPWVPPNTFAMIPQVPPVQAMQPINPFAFVSAPNPTMLPNQLPQSLWPALLPPQQYPGSFRSFTPPTTLF